MAKTYRCPACQNEVERAAIVCSNPSCRRDLAFCSYCRDVTTYVSSGKSRGRGGGWLAREHLKCDRCGREGVKCVTWLMGAYCNGLARAGERVDAPLCANCLEQVGAVGRNVAVWGLMGALSGLLRRRK